MKCHVRIAFYGLDSWRLKGPLGRKENGDRGVSLRLASD